MPYNVLLWAGVVGMATSATLMPTLMPMVNSTAADCEDDPNGDCWSRPDADCFEIYEPWSHVHCPLRCGFCPGKLPPCEDKLPYCDRFEEKTCSQDNYLVWARNNCRKHCNLCAVPTRPPSNTTVPPVTDSGSSKVPTPGGTGGQTTEGINMGQTTGGTDKGNVTDLPGQMNTTHAHPSSITPHDIPGTVARGVQNTLLIQGPASQADGMCLYHGKDYKEGDRWNDGCTYECSCMNSAQNIVVCTERCTRWELSASLTACKLVQEDNECCPRLECIN
ncbi:hypothetical protein ACOMHN_016123 [Nucella lapillus]